MRSGRDYGSQIAHTLVQLADVLEGLEPDQWGAPSLCDRWSVRDVVGHIVWRVGESYLEMARSGLPMLALARFGLDDFVDAISRQEAEAYTPEELVRRLRRIAAFREAGLGRTGFGDLTESIVHGYDIVQPLGVPLHVEPDLTRRVALRGLLLAGGVQRAVVARHTLWAADAGWAIGRGPLIEGSAQGIVLFLYGRKPLAR